MKILLLAMGLCLTQPSEAQVGVQGGSDWGQVLKDDSDKLEFLDELLGNIQGFAQKQVELLANESIDEWLEMPYSRLSVEKIDQLISKYRVGKDRNLQQKCAQLGRLKSDLLIYQEAVQAVNTEYDGNTVNRLSAQVRQIQARTDAQKIEVDELHQQLSNYDAAYDAFSRIKKQIKDETDGVTFGKKDLVVAILKRVDKAEQAMIQQIPWLKGQYSQLKNIQ